MTRTSKPGRIALAATAVALLGISTTACGEDVVDNDVEQEINEIDDSIEDFVDTLFTDTTGG